MEIIRVVKQLLNDKVVIIYQCVNTSLIKHIVITDNRTSVWLDLIYGIVVYFYILCLYIEIV